MTSRVFALTNYGSSLPAIYSPARYAVTAGRGRGGADMSGHGCRETFIRMNSNLEHSGLLPPYPRGSTSVFCF